MRAPPFPPVDMSDDLRAVPAVGGDAQWKAPVSTTLHAYTPHLVFGGTTQIGRRQVARTLTPPSETNS